MNFGMETDACGVPNITSKSTFASMTMQKLEVVDDEFNIDRICTSVICSSQRLASSGSSNKSKKTITTTTMLINNTGSSRRKYFLFHVTFIYVYYKSKASVSCLKVRSCDVSVQCDHH